MLKFLRTTTIHGYLKTFCSDFYSLVRHLATHYDESIWFVINKGNRNEKEDIRTAILPTNEISKLIEI